MSDHTWQDDHYEVRWTEPGPFGYETVTSACCDLREAERIAGDHSDARIFRIQRRAEVRWSRE